MASKITPSLDEAIDYALVHVGNKKTAQLVRACIFSDGIDDQHSLAPQLASALMQAVERQVGRGATRGRPDRSGRTRLLRSRLGGNRPEIFLTLKSIFDAGAQQ